MVYLEEIKIKKNYRNLKKNSIIKCNSINLIVGEQGCGKSTLLNLLNEHSDKLKITLTETTKKIGVSTFYFDSEKMNPRINDLDTYSNPNGISKGIGIGAALSSRFKSHGEVLKQFTVNRINQAKDCILFLDEPESALSLKNQYLLAKEIIKTANENNVQFFISTHCLPLIESIEEVYSLEHNKWLASTEFINLSKI